MSAIFVDAAWVAPLKGMQSSLSTLAYGRSEYCVVRKIRLLVSGSTPFGYPYSDLQPPKPATRVLANNSKSFQNRKIRMLLCIRHRIHLFVYFPQILRNHHF